MSTSTPKIIINSNITILLLLIIGCSHIHAPTIEKISHNSKWAKKIPATDFSKEEVSIISQKIGSEVVEPEEFQIVELINISDITPISTESVYRASRIDHLFSSTSAPIDPIQMKEAPKIEAIPTQKINTKKILPPSTNKALKINGTFKFGSKLNSPIQHKPVASIKTTLSPAQQENINYFIIQLLENSNLKKIKEFAQFHGLPLDYLWLAQAKSVKENSPYWLFYGSYSELSAAKAEIKKIKLIYGVKDVKLKKLPRGISLSMLKDY